MNAVGVSVHINLYLPISSVMIITKLGGLGMISEKGKPVSAKAKLTVGTPVPSFRLS